MGRDFYDDLRVARSYDRCFPGLPGEAEFYVRLAEEARDAGLPVLELGCGTGRVAIAAARQGACVLGLDRSAAMLAVAREKGRGISNVAWLQADMACFALRQRFGLIMVPYRSLLHLESRQRQLDCLKLARQHLAPGGRLVFNVWNGGAAAYAQQLASAWSGAVRAVSGGSVSARRASAVYPGMRLLDLGADDVRALLAAAGLSVEACYGWFDGRPLTPESSEQVWLARRD